MLTWIVAPLVALIAFCIVILLSYIYIRLARMESMVAATISYLANKAYGQATACDVTNHDHPSLSIVGSNFFGNGRDFDAIHKKNDDLELGPYTNNSEEQYHHHHDGGYYAYGGGSENGDNGSGTQENSTNTMALVDPHTGGLLGNEVYQNREQQQQQSPSREIVTRSPSKTPQSPAAHHKRGKPPKLSAEEVKRMAAARVFKELHRKESEKKAKERLDKVKQEAWLSYAPPTPPISDQRNGERGDANQGGGSAVVVGSDSNDQMRKRNRLLPAANHPVPMSGSNST
jgi:hypothetical protein